jgi:carbon-monoxide dehydrogenase small subunit
MTATHRIQLELNGEHRVLDVAVDASLLEVLRDDLGLTGTKEGCLVGVCGLCSVIVDEELVSGCLLLAVLADSAKVTTVEGLADGDRLSGLQEAFITEGGFQCGICTPGQLVAASALLAENPLPTPDESVEWMMGNLCRCTGYYGITRAIQKAAERR